MKNEEFKGRSNGRTHSGGGYKRKEHSHRGGAKTFRRGRAIAFLEMMNIKRSTIKQQLEEPEFQSINQILVGELKAIDMIINEFIQLFEIQESEAMDICNKRNGEREASVLDSTGTLDDSEKGIELNETN